MACDSKKGFSLIELITVIVIIVILSVSGAYLMSYVVQNSVFIPNQLNADMLASDALDIMIEGDTQAGGLRFSKSLTNAQDDQVTFNTQDNQAVRFRLDTSTDPSQLYRSINGGPETPVPYYITNTIAITGKNNKLFIYYDAGNNITNNPANVRRIVMTLIAKTGTGLYTDWEGQSEQSSSVAVKRFQ